MPVSSIRNLGPAADKAYARAGIHDADTLRELGADAAYGRLLASGARPHFIGYYVLVMGLQGRPWNDCHGTEKDALRARFDALRATADATEATASSPQKSRARLDAALAEIGVIKPPQPTISSPEKK